MSSLGANGPFSETLSSITTTKLRELSKKHAAYEQQKASLLLSVQLEKDQQRQVRILVDGVKQCFQIKTKGRLIHGSSNEPALELLLANLDRFLEQARYDPSISTEQLCAWKKILSGRLDIQSSKYQFASLYGQLTNEWLADEQGTIKTSDDIDDDAEDGERMDYQKEVRQDKRKEQREAWEALAFTELPTDPIAIEQYLDALFSKDKSSGKVYRALKSLKGDIERYCVELTRPGQFTLESLQWTIRGLTKSDLLTDDKRNVLNDFAASDIILSEIGDVLNMRLASLDSWNWDGDVHIEQRRRVNGRYDIFMHEDLLQAIFLQYIGVKWSVFLRQKLTLFMKSEGAWIALTKNIPRRERKRREHFMGMTESLKPSLRSIRKALFADVYFMSQLLSSEHDDNGDEDGVMELDYSPASPPAAAAPRNRMKMRRAHEDTGPYTSQAPGRAILAAAPAFPKRARITVPQEDEDIEHIAAYEQPKTQMDKKHKILHLVATEMKINSKLHGDFTCFRSDFDDIGTSLPHSTLLAVLAFFGISDIWLEFFKRFLRVPLKFEDEPGATAKVQKRGVPRSHVLSTVFIESVLFCADFAVNQAGDGAQLFRTADDFWLWSADHNKCINSWAAIGRFCHIMGVTLSKAKSGSVRAYNKPIHLSLPKAPIRWGFLYLDTSSGGFVIDQSIVDKHVSELRSQLEEKHSIFAWVKAWNTYASTFFTTNFGVPANCFGRDHVDNMLTTFSSIQRSIFKSTGSVVEHLKSTIRDRFGVSDIPDGYLFFPTELGGLELSSPFIPLLQIRESIPVDIDELLNDFLISEKDFYEAKRKEFEDNYDVSTIKGDPDFDPEDANVFFSYEEFISSRESVERLYMHESSIRGVFDRLMAKPVEQCVDDNEAMMKECRDLGRLNMGGGINADFHSMTGYWKWVVGLYGPDMVERFGGLNIVDPGLLPIAMVSMFRSGRVKWQG